MGLSNGLGNSSDKKLEQVAYHLLADRASKQSSFSNLLRKALQLKTSNLRFEIFELLDQLVTVANSTNNNPRSEKTVAVWMGHVPVST